MVLQIPNNLICRSNQSRQLSLDEKAISEAMEIQKTLFLRSWEILGEVSSEGTAFEKFSSWLLMMVEDILADEDADVDAPPLHLVDEHKVAEYISERFARPILAKFERDMEEEDEEGYWQLERKMAEHLKGFFQNASAELKEGVSWMLPRWVSLEIHDRIAASDALFIVQDGTTFLYIAVALLNENEIRVYRAPAPSTEFVGNPQGPTVELSRFLIYPENTTEHVVRDVMFLDEEDILVVGSFEGIPLTYDNSRR